MNSSSPTVCTNADRPPRMADRPTDVEGFAECVPPGVETSEVEADAQPVAATLEQENDIRPLNERSSCRQRRRLSRIAALVLLLLVAVAIIAAANLRAATLNESHSLPTLEPNRPLSPPFHPSLPPTSPCPCAPPNWPLLAINDWPHASLSTQPPSADERALWVSPAAATAEASRLYQQLESMLLDAPPTTTSAAKDEEAAVHAAVGRLCTTVGEAIERIGLNGVLNVAARFYLEQSRTQALYAVLVRGFASYDLVHLPAAIAMSDALRRPHPARLIRSAWALSARATWPDGARPLEAPIHASAWTRLLENLTAFSTLALPPVSPPHGERTSYLSYREGRLPHRSAIPTAAAPEAERFWAVGLEQCAPYLNEWTYVHCLHGISHAVLKRVHYRAAEVSTGAPLVTAAMTTGSAPQPLRQPPLPPPLPPRCTEMGHAANLSRAAFDDAAQLASAAPSPGLRLMAGLGLWMDVLNYLRATRAFDGLPAAPWLATPFKPPQLAWLGVAEDGRTEGRAPCDAAPLAAACFARFFGEVRARDDTTDPTHTWQRLLVHDWRHNLSAADGAPADVVSARRALPAAVVIRRHDCLHEPMADEAHVRGCIFGVALNSYSSVDGAVQDSRRQDDPPPSSTSSARPSLALFCASWVDHLRLRDGAEARERERLRLLACVSGSMVGIGYGWVADERIPGQLVAAHCAQVHTLSWLLTRSEASHAERICFESGTLCSVAQPYPCADSTQFMSSLGNVLEG